MYFNLVDIIFNAIYYVLYKVLIQFFLNSNSSGL